MATEHRLAPCPWCGQTDQLRRTGAARGKRWVYCGCGGTGPVALGDDLATAAWNKREPPYAEEFAAYEDGRKARNYGAERRPPYSNEVLASAWRDGWDVQHAEVEGRTTMATEDDYRAGEQARVTGVAIEGNPHPADSAEAIVWRKGWNDKDREIREREPNEIYTPPPPAKPKVVQLVVSGSHDNAVVMALKDDGTIWQYVAKDKWDQVATPGEAHG